MGSSFSGSEIVELGIQIERNGFDFYNDLASAIKDEKAKEVFEFLAVEESKHIKVFGKILNSVQDYEPVELYPEEYFAYLKKIADQSVFTKDDKGHEIASKIKDRGEAIEMAVSFEEESIRFFEEAKKVVSPEDELLIDKIILQEEEHIKKLNGLKNAV
ncbi:MAG: ferritin family protein [Candidatus Aureabacteria bacterium]|nr:ferritin family protein [Candidatus Auribacterota bacterium]